MYVFFKLLQCFNTESLISKWPKPECLGLCFERKAFSFFCCCSFPLLLLVRGKRKIQARLRFLVAMGFLGRTTSLGRGSEVWWKRHCPVVQRAVPALQLTLKVPSEGTLQSHPYRVSFGTQGCLDANKTIFSFLFFFLNKEESYICLRAVKEALRLYFWETKKKKTHIFL